MGAKEATRGENILGFINSIEHLDMFISLLLERCKIERDIVRRGKAVSLAVPQGLGHGGENPRYLLGDASVEKSANLEDRVVAL